MMRNVADRPFERMVAYCQGLRGTCSLQGMVWGKEVGMDGGGCWSANGSLKSEWFQQEQPVTSVGGVI